MDSISIGKKIKKIRNKNKLTQEAFASSLNVTYQAVSKWENGKSIPDIEILNAICEKYKVDINYILGNKTKNSIVYVSIVVLLTLVLFLGVFIFKNTNDFEFKTISSHCSAFKINGSIAYNKRKTSIHVANIEYCGEDDEEVFLNMESMIYIIDKNVEKKIASKTFKDYNTLKGYLKELEFAIDSEYKDCRVFSNSNLNLVINLTNEDGKIITYQIPLTLKDKCEI